MTYFAHHVRIPLNLDIWDPDGCAEEIAIIYEWLDQATDWQPNQYSVSLLASQKLLDVWFMDEKIATQCRLRWS